MCSRASSTWRSTPTSRATTTTTSSTRSAIPNADRLSRFTANSTLTGHRSRAASSSSTRTRRSPTAEHHGGAITFGNDGKLYFTTGDHFQGTPSQDLNSPRGKIHRINPDGIVPTDNPFYDGAGPALGFGLGLRPAQSRTAPTSTAPTGRLYIGDVGGNGGDRERGARPRRPRRQLRLARLSKDPARRRARARSTTTAQRQQRLAHHGRLRLPRHAVPQPMRGQLLLRRLRPALDQADDVRRDRQRQRRLQLRAAHRDQRSAGDIVYLTEGPDGALYYLDLGYCRHRPARSASARSAASATCSPTKRRWRSRRRTRHRAPRRLT